MLTYVTTAFQLAVNQSYIVYLNGDHIISSFIVYMAEFSVVQIPIAIIEAAFTAITIQYIATHKPEILKWWHK
jgi:ABC-type Co2+ transport system permease subunit